MADGITRGTTPSITVKYPLMSAVMMTNDGFVLASQAYQHDAQPAPEPESE